MSFWARGAVGGELVLFLTGQGLNLPCSDYSPARYPGAGGNYGISLATPPAWQNYTIDISGLDYSAAHVAPGQGSGGYYGGVIGAFGFTVADQTLPSAGPCPANLICAAFGGPSAPPNDSDPDGGLIADPAMDGRRFPPSCRRRSTWKRRSVSSRRLRLWFVRAGPVIAGVERFAEM